MRSNEITPATTSSAISMKTRKRLRIANWTTRWIIRESGDRVIGSSGEVRVVHYSFWLSYSVLLQRICELQKQRALRDYLIAGLQSRHHLRLAVHATSDIDPA